jgi:hypothetical protein
MAYAGFDRSNYPGGAVMRWLKANTNLVFCGFYLAPAPSHPDQSWMNADDVDLDGWGFAPIFVGRQTLGPGSHDVTAQRGTADGADACRLMAQAGFDPGSFLYLDLENPDPVHQSAYVAAWIDAVVVGGYGPGVYTSFMDSAQIAALRPGVRIWSYHVPSVTPHRVSGSVFPAPDPTTSGYPGATIWQFADEAQITCGAAPGGTLTVDLNSASSPDPSAP